MKFFKDASGLKIWIEKVGNQMWVHFRGKSFPFEPSSQKAHTKEEEEKPFISNLKAPFPGRVVSVKVKDNDKVAPYQHLIVIESMKMEHTLCVYHPSKIQSINVKKGQSIEFGQSLINLKSVGEAEQ